MITRQSFGSCRVIVALSLTLSALAACSNPPTAEIILQREWTANAEYVGDVWAATISRPGAPAITVREGAEALDPIKTVRSGDAQIGVASADRVLRDNEGGAGLVILAAATYRSPVVFLTHPSDHITSPSDFKGRVVGIQTGTNTELVFKSLLSAQGIPLEQVRVVESGWGTQTFETGAISVLAAFDYDEPVQLARKSIQYGILYPERYGVKYVGTVYFTSRSYAAAHPEAIQAFMDSLVEGWRAALAQPDEAIRRLKAKFPGVDADKERQSLERGRAYFQGENGELLYATPERWESMAQNLVQLGLLKEFNFDRNVDYRFLENALRK